MKSEIRSGVSARDFVETFFRRKQIVFITLPLMILAVAVIALVTAKRFESEMKILVQNSRSNIVISAQVTTAASVNDVTEQQINSELEILHSHDVLDAVADPTWSSKPVAQRTPQEVFTHNKLVTQLESRLTTDAGRKSNIITVVYQGTSPAESQQTLQRLSNAFIAEERYVQRPTGASEFFVQQAENYRRAWNDAEQNFVDFQQKNNLVSLPDQVASDQKDIDALQGQLRVMDTGLSEFQARLQESAVRLRETPERETTVEKTVPNQEGVQALNTLLVTLENKRTALLNQFKSDDRLVQEIDTQIEQTRTALETASRTNSQERTTDVNPAWQQMRIHVLQDEIGRKALEKQRDSVQKQLTSLQAELSRIQALSVQYNQLKSRVDDLKQNYAVYTQKRDQAQIEDKMDAQQLLNVTIAEHPTFSYIPVSPRPARDLLLALISGIFLSIGIVYVAELSRTTVVNPYEMEMASPYQLLATVPLLPPEAVDTLPCSHHIVVSNVEDLERLLRKNALPTLIAEERSFEHPPKNFIQ
jgi:uncharacterized protein involved in exopolysaccharide biosynthesis